MKRALKLAAEIDPLLPTAVISAGGKDYTVSLDIGTLIDAEEELIARGHDVSLLTAMPPLSASKTRTLFAMAVRRHHPEVEYEDARNLLDLRGLSIASNVFCKLYMDSMRPDEEAQNGLDPTGAASLGD